MKFRVVTTHKTSIRRINERKGDSSRVTRQRVRPIRPGTDSCFFHARILGESLLLATSLVHDELERPFMRSSGKLWLFASPSTEPQNSLLFQLM